jgi:hypothetical protein
MILEYHTQLLKFSIPRNYFSEFKTFSFINYKLLLNGLHYPDLPCNTLVISSNNEIKYLNYNACSIPSTLVYLLYEEHYGLKQTVQSHRGRQAVGHSMTYDDTETMITIRQKILRRLEILYMLALNDNSTCYAENRNISQFSCLENPPNIFWIGQILHCIQDSYSKVHTLRQSQNEKKVIAPYIVDVEVHPKTTGTIGTRRTRRTTRLLNSLSLPSISLSKSITSQIKTKSSDVIDMKIKKPYDFDDKLSRKEHFNYTFKLIRYINIHIINSNKFKEEFKDNITSDNIAIYIKKVINDASDIDDYDKTEFLKIIDNNPNDLFSIFKLMYFFYHQKNRLLLLFDNNCDLLPSHINLDKNINEDPNYPYITSFYYIPDQQNCEPLFHIKNDIRKANISNEKYNIKNCKHILELYKIHVFDTTKTLQEKIIEFIDYISINVFPIPLKFHHYTSSQIIKEDICLTKK